MKRLLMPIFLVVSSMMINAQERRGRRMVDHAPAVDAPIPKVSAKSQANGKMVAINEPKRLTVHVFGSHT
jgi:hypothetical protein